MKMSKSKEAKLVQKMHEVLFRAAALGDWSQIPWEWKSNRDFVMSLPDPLTGDNAMHVAARAGTLHKVPKELFSVVAFIAQNSKGEVPVNLVQPDDSEKCIQNLTPEEQAYMRLRAAEHAESIKKQAAAGQKELVFRVRGSPPSLN
jgi:hypothetical protein